MFQTLIKDYRIDYLLFVLVVMILSVIALLSHSNYLILIPISLAWSYMLYKAGMDLLQKRLGNEFFLVFATIIALIGHQEQAIVIVLLIMLIARYIELLVEQRTSRALKSLTLLIPNKVLVVEDDHEKIIPVEQVTRDMKVIVKAGGRIPADGFIIDGQAAINEASLTGESIPKEKHVNDLVFAGTFIESGAIVFQVQQVHEQTLFGKMTALIKEAEKQKAQISLLTEKIVLIITPVLLVFIFLIWFFTNNISFVITLLIFGSPLELTLVAPISFLAASIAAFQKGILVKSGRVLESLAKSDTLIFDKTGTLTLGHPVVTNIQSFDSRYTKIDILRIAAIAERRSEHVIAQAILQKAFEEGLEIPQPETYTSEIGHGVEITFEGKRYFLGNTHYIEAPEHGGSPIPSHALETTAAYSIFFLATEHTVIGKISLTDAIRPDALDTITNLQKKRVYKKLFS